MIKNKTVIKIKCPVCGKIEIVQTVLPILDDRCYECMKLGLSNNDD